MKERTKLQNWQFWRLFNAPGCLFRASGNLKIVKTQLKRNKLITEKELYYINQAIWFINKARHEIEINALAFKPKKEEKMNKAGK
jgi:hypothetical protein